MQKGGEPKRRGFGQWVLIAITVTCGLGMLIGFAVSEVSDSSLRAHGVRAVASVEDKQVSGRDNSYLLAFNGGDGVRLFEWSGDVPSDTKVGDQIQVIYDPHDPSTVQDTRDLSRGPWAALIFLPAGLFFLWLSRSWFRADPEAFRWWLRNRYRIR